MGENAEVEYSIAEGDGADMFDVITDKDTQEGIITVKQVSSCCLHFLIEHFMVYFCFLGKMPRIYFFHLLHASVLHINGNSCDFSSSELSIFITDT